VVEESGAVEVVLPPAPLGSVVVVEISLPGSVVGVVAGDPDPRIVVDVVGPALEVVVVVEGWVVVVAGTVVVVVWGTVVVVVVVGSTSVPRISTVSMNTSLLRSSPEKRKRTLKVSELKSLTSMVACSLIPEASW